MNQLDHTGRIAEFGRTHNTHRQRRTLALIGALCAVAFIYDTFPTVADVLNIAALVVVAAAGIALAVWLTHRHGGSNP